VDYPDYQFARFNIQTEPLDYTDTEYLQHLQVRASCGFWMLLHPWGSCLMGDALERWTAEHEKKAQGACAGGGQETGWTRPETDELCRLCQRYDLRWPVVFDRFPPGNPPKTIEQLQVSWPNQLQPWP
jgi:hypothetical protein